MKGNFAMLGTSLPLRVSAVAMWMLATTTAQPAEAGAPKACAALTSFKAPGFNMVIAQAVEVPEGPVPAIPFGPAFSGNLPAYCRVDGVIDPRAGRDGKPYAIGFAVAMPVNWNGRFLMQGGGGLNGNVALPIGSVAAGDVPALARGFAVVTTDSGHKSSAVFDASFLADQEATVNFLYQAVGKVAQVGKQVVLAHYGRAAAHSYFMGCSTGGREAMLMSQRYPDFFDGIIAGAPAMRTTHSNLADKWITVALNQVAPKDDQGRPQTSRALSDSDRKLVIDSVLQACDANDGVADGMISDPKGLWIQSSGSHLQGPEDRVMSDARPGCGAGERIRRARRILMAMPYTRGSGLIPALPTRRVSPVCSTRARAPWAGRSRRPRWMSTRRRGSLPRRTRRSGTLLPGPNSTRSRGMAASSFSFTE